MRIRRNGRIETNIWELIIWIGLWVTIIHQILQSIHVHNTPSSTGNARTDKTGTALSSEDLVFPPNLSSQQRPQGQQGKPQGEGQKFSIEEMKDRKQQEHHDTEEEEEEGSDEGKRKDWFNRDYWINDNDTNSCFFVENICHSAQTWFYDTSSSSSGSAMKHNEQNSTSSFCTVTPSSTKQSSSSNFVSIDKMMYPYQPWLKLILRWYPRIHHVPIETVPHSYPDSLIVRCKDRLLDTFNISTDHWNCPYSPIPNHMILHSYSNHMLGEFYTRSLMGLWDIVQSVHHHLRSSNRTDRDIEDLEKNDNAKYDNDIDALFERQTQLYLHFQEGRKVSELLESHRLLLDLISLNPVLSFRRLLDNTHCRCIKRLFFCGYQSMPLNADADFSRIPNALLLPKNASTTMATAATSGNDNDNNMKNDGVVILQPYRSIGFQKHNQRLSKSQSNAKGRMRDALLNHISDTKNPLLHEQIIWQRYQTLKRAGVWDDHPLFLSTTETKAATLSVVANRKKTFTAFALDDQKHWKIIGLAQRTSRRTWIGLNDIEKRCNEQFLKSHRIICLIVNIETEEWSNPVQHVVAHASLDGLIGIHGAQLTEALFMPSQSLVVEFLPWIHSDINWGQWTRWVHRPTPLGVLFSETDLNHIGYPLHRNSSVDTCAGPDYTRHCFDLEEHHWDNRNFIIPYEYIDDVITKFVIWSKEHTNNEAKHCNYWNDQAGSEYILYNIYCIDKKKGALELSPRHFYRSKNWMNERIQYDPLLPLDLNRLREEKIN